jgi:hypothetical protein
LILWQTSSRYRIVNCKFQSAHSDIVTEFDPSAESVSTHQRIAYSSRCRLGRKAADANHPTSTKRLFLLWHRPSARFKSVPPHKTHRECGLSVAQRATMKRTHGEMRAHSPEDDEANNGSGTPKSSSGGTKSHQPKISRKIRACKSLVSLCYSTLRISTSLYTCRYHIAIVESPALNHASQSILSNLPCQPPLFHAQLSVFVSIRPSLTVPSRPRMPKPQNKVRYRARRFRLRSMPKVKSPLRGEQKPSNPPRR